MGSSHESNNGHFKVFDIKNNKLVKTFNTKPEAESFIDNFEGDMVMDDDGQWVDLGDNLEILETCGCYSEPSNIIYATQKETELRNLVKETIKRLTERKGLGKNFDAWADIESGGEYSDAVIKNKQYYNKLKNSPVDNSNIPEYYYQRGHDGPIRNIHGYTQNQIDTENNRLRKHSRYESSIDEYDD